MNEKPGLRTTEFMVVVILGGISIISGLQVDAGVVNYHANMDLLNQLFILGMTYIGGRSAVKVAGTMKGPKA